MEKKCRHCGAAYNRLALCPVRSAASRAKNDGYRSIPTTHEAETDVTVLEDQRPHFVGFCLCRECFHWDISVVDARADLTTLECSRCFKQKSYFVHDKDVVGLETQKPG
jgi:hypothetical protein